MFFGIYDQVTGDVFVMPEEVVESHDKWWRNYHRPFFDADGEYLYYNWGGRAMRYNVSTHQLDTIRAGNVPIIPWNSKAVVVHNTDRSQVRLLDADMNVRATIDGKLDGMVLSALSGNDQTYLFS